MKPNLSIESMKEEDLAAVQELAEQLGYAVGIEDLSSRLGLLQQSMDHKLLVARNEADKVLGWVHVGKEMSSLLIGERAEVSALIVDSQTRGQGIGKLLLKAAESWALDRGYILVRVRSNVKRDEAHRFYIRAGYTLNKTSNLFIKDLNSLINQT